MKQKRTAQQEVDALRAVVIRQRAILNDKCKESELYKQLYDSACKRAEETFINFQESLKQRENLKEKATDHYVRMRIAIAFMLSAIRNGYKFQDEEAERLFCEFCDSSGVTEQDRAELFQDEQAKGGAHNG